MRFLDRWRQPPPYSLQRLNWNDEINWGLSGMWMLDNPGGSTTGGTQWDLVGRYHGTVTGGCDSVQTLQGRACSFDGSSGRVKVTGFRLFSGGSGVTMSVWARATSFTQSGMLLEKTLVNASYEMFCENDGFFYLRGGGTTYVRCVVPSGGAWHHFVATISGTTGTVYIDGVAQASGTVEAPADPAGDLYISSFDGGGYFFTGQMARAAVWNRGLQHPTKDSTPDQTKLENQYRTVLARGLSSRSGGLGLEDSKVQQANHLLALLDQNYDPKTGEYNIPAVMQNELALGLARLTSPGGQVGIELMKEMNQASAKGDVAKLFTYATGKPITGSTQDIIRMFKDSIQRQGEVALENREGEMRYLRGLAPTELDEDRRQKLEANSLNPLRLSKIIQNKKTGERKIVVSTDGGKTWK